MSMTPRELVDGRTVEGVSCDSRLCESRINGNCRSHTASSWDGDLNKLVGGQDKDLFDVEYISPQRSTHYLLVPGIMKF